MAEAIKELIPTRATLIQRLKDWQDQPSWQEFFDTYWKLIYGVAIKGGLNETEAQDVVQETMISAAKHMPTFQYDPGIGSFKAWLLNMTRWRIIDHIRKRQMQPSYLSASEDSVGGTGTVNRVADPASQNLEALWDAEWEKNRVEAGLGESKRQAGPLKYQMFDFYVNKEWAPEKVAETFHVPVDQVYLIKHRITAMIKAEVKRIEIEI